MPIKKPAAIAADNLTFTRNGERLLDRFSFEIPSGAYVAVIGPNGSGKTTLMHLLLGLVKPADGSVELFGRPPDDPRSRRRVGYVPQRGGTLDPSFPATAEELVNAGRSQALGIWKHFGPEDREAVDRAFEVLDIGHLRRRTISALSGGELQRVLLARALSTDPDLLILDEPVEGLDVDSRAGFHAALKKLNRQGRTILFVTHEVHTIAKEADAAICLRHELVCHGTKACVITGGHLRNLYHGSHEEMAEHVS
jgi:zinc transport system ATP-binding protein